MMHFTAGTPLPGPSQNSPWRSDLFGALRRRTKTNPKNSRNEKNNSTKDVSFDVAYAEVPRALRQRPSILLASSEIELGGGPTGRSSAGQKQTFAVHQPMSALPPKADMCGATRDVRFGPKADIQHASQYTLRVWTIALGRHGRSIKEGQGKGCRDV
jgi:hypothetical protein